MLNQLALDLQAVPGRVNWYRTETGDWSVLESRVLELQDEHSLGAWQLFCGALDYDGHSIYAIEGASPIELARAFQTGSHNAWDTDQVADELTRVFGIAPFRPYFIDIAGYKCRFDPPLSRTQAELIEQVLTVGMETYCDVDDLSMVSILLSENALRLWWD